MYESQRRSTALHWAAENNRLEVARLLLEGGADIEARDEVGWQDRDPSFIVSTTFFFFFSGTRIGG